MTTPAGFLAFTLLQTLLITAVFVVLCDGCKRLFALSDLLAFCAAVFALGVMGYAAFWLAFASYPLFAKVKIAALAVLLLRFGWIVYRRELGGYRWLAEPLVFTCLFLLAVTALGFSAGGMGDPASAAQNRFSHSLPPDNIIPYIVGIALQAGFIPSPLAGTWLMSDRPPLQTGLYMLLTLRNHELAYQVVCAWLQASFLFGAWGLAVAAQVPVAARRLVLLACCVLPTAIINTFYTWPKMLTVGYLLLVFALLFCRKPADDRERKAFGVLIGGLAALSALGHGSSLFALFGFTVVVLAFWAWPPLKTMIYSAVTAVALYVPWMVYQTAFDPPANRLLKWHFAGVVDIDDRTFLAALRDSYAALSWDDYVYGKLESLRPLIGGWPQSVLDPVVSLLRGGAWNVAGTRSHDFFHLLPSLHAYSFALICAVILLPFLNAGQRPQRDAAVRMLVALAAICAVFVLTIFQPGQTINHQGTYTTQVMATVCAFMVLAVRARFLALAFIAVQAVTVSATYAFTLPHQLWLLAAAAGVATLALAAYALVPSLRRAG